MRLRATSGTDATFEACDAAPRPRVALAQVGGIERLTWDYPITTPQTVPGLAGSTATFATIEACDAAGIACYSGGQFELGIGRTQVQSIASLCFPDGPNDCAPVMFHGATPERLEAVTGPVTPPAGHVGFGWDAPTPANAV